VCGTESIDDVLALCDVTRSAHWDGLVLRPEVLVGLPDTLRAEQRVFESTGGLHAAGLFDRDGSALVVREDIGRHNAVDKVVGARLLAGHSPAVPALCVSGRIGFEIVQKAVMADVGAVAAVGAPSSLAVDLAVRAGLCTCGFVRGGRYVVYSAPERLGV
jgi:FdhD protein